MEFPLEFFEESLSSASEDIKVVDIANFSLLEGNVVYDIETEPIGDEMLVQIVPPFKCKLKEPGDFDPESVKYGNTKDPAKRAAKLKDAEESHARAVRDFQKAVDAAEREYWESAAEGATLLATRSKLCVLLMRECRSDATNWIIYGDEYEIIQTFWRQAEKCANAANKMIGFCTSVFDNPYIRQRSFINGIIPPSWILESDRYWASVFVDLSRIWSVGGKERIQLGELAQAMGIGSKYKLDVSGDLFHVFWNSGDPDDRAKAVEYAANDLLLPYLLAIRMGVVV